jgi:hypothetical protein
MRLATLAVVMFASAGAPTELQPLLSPGPPLRVGQGSGTLVLGDVNGDGRTDLLSHHSLARMVTVQLGNGRGGFAASLGSPIPLPYHSGGMALGDLDRDGRQDIAVTAGQEDIVDVLLGTGTGEFRRTRGSPFTVTTAVEPFNKRTIRLDDINEDGHLDVITANGRRRNSFEVMLGDGRGGLSRGPSVKLDAGCDGYVFVLGDVNGDRHLDGVNACHALNAPDRAARVTVLLGDGTGVFTVAPGSPFQIPTGARSIELADMNGDRRADLAVMDARGSVTILANTGGGRFSPAQRPAAHMGGDAYALRVADLNRDGTLDFVAAAVDRIVVLLAGRSGYTAAQGSPFKAGPGAYNVVVGDLNADGVPDLAASSFEGDALTLLYGR